MLVDSLGDNLGDAGYDTDQPSSIGDGGNNLSKPDHRGGVVDWSVDKENWGR